jgi:hypothetical protein
MKSGENCDHNIDPRVSEMGSIISMLEDMEGKKPGEDNKTNVDDLFRWSQISVTRNSEDDQKYYYSITYPTEETFLHMIFLIAADFIKRW